eukprot:TRINITY_DN7490_c0_g1_i2.p1 TRINITY_DN7490_c0_g1~~TRINITY_DN7490_c0_g1_i2.p1  ORF type:complete len:242 (-),score=29.87 TRINITY_DN7490_c0_g1_i2:142-867(-)
MMSICKTLPLVDSGNNCTDDDRPLYTVAVLRMEGKKFAILHSVSHVLGDGHTFYELYGMLSPRGKAERLTWHRFMDFEEEAKNRLGRSELTLISSPWMAVGIVRGIVFKKQPKPVIKLINMSYVEKVKDEVAKSQPTDTKVSFVSTNDVITSWVMSSFAAPFYLMAINLRGRVKEVTNSHAGNYESGVVYLPPDVQSPQLIRCSLQRPDGTFRRAVTAAAPVVGDHPSPSHPWCDQLWCYF